MNGFLSPAEIAEVWVQNGIKKAKLPIGKMLILGVFAGIFIGLGAHGFLTATAPGGSAAEAMLQKFIGASVFPAGLMMVIICGAELFTGNNLLTLALGRKEITVSEMLTNWIFVYIGNFIGSVLLALFLAKSGLFAGALAEKAIAVAQSKSQMPFMEAIIRGMLCNIVVVLACWFQAGSKDIAGKILAIWFPIMLFVFAGFEHSVANMTYIPLGMFLGAEVSVSQFLMGNLIPVTIGNMIGGAVIVPVAYYYAYLKK